MAKVIDYVTVNGSDAAQLDTRIKGLLVRGYQPHGSPYFRDALLCQAMIKVDESGQTDQPAPGGG